MAGLRKKELLQLIARIAVGGVLAYAGFRKAVSPAAEFVAAIDAYHLLPYRAIPPVAVALPWIELLTGTYVLAGFLLRYTSRISSALFGLFLAVLGVTLARGMDLATCGCFGGETLSPRQTIGIDIVLFLVAVALARSAGTADPFTVDFWMQRVPRNRRARKR